MNVARYHVDLVDAAALVVVQSEPASTETFALSIRDRMEHLPSSLAGRTIAHVVEED